MKLLKFPLLTLFIIFTYSCSVDPIEDDVESIELNLTDQQTKNIEVEILELINAHRLSKGLNTLSSLSLVKSVAYTHTDYMVENNVVSHDNFYKRSNYLKSNIQAQNVSENVAYGYSSANSVVNAWLKSESHKANIEGDYTNFDISAKENAEGEFYYTNIFIKL